MSRRPRAPWIAGLAFLPLANLAACNFNAAFSRYCKDNPRCVPDAGGGPEARPSPDLSPDLRPDLSPDTRPDLAPDLSPDLAPDLSPDLVADAYAGRVDSGGTRPMGMCTSRADCNGSMEICHPTALFCVPTCRGPADCPLGLDTCIEVRGQPGDPSPPPKICACSGSLACGQLAPGFRCNRMDKLCQPACAIAADCSMFRPSRVCDPYYSTCVECLPASADCSNRSDGLTECDSTGRCVAPR